MSREKATSNDKEGINMIAWQESFDAAVQKAKTDGKLIVMDFFNPG
jgi:hypothetical protein